MALHPGIGTADVVEELYSAGLVRFAPVGSPQPQLAQGVPSLDNGLWKVFPDGRMELTYRLREGLKWHDGTPLTAHDVVFAAQLGQDPEMPEFRHEVYGYLERVRAVDERTVVTEWKELYIQAHILFSYEVGVPLPRHLLEDAYLADKAHFAQLRFWMSDEYVHAGPFRVREFLTGQQLIVEAFDGYVFGRPKLDEIEVRIIPDANTLIANVLAGAVHVTIGGTALTVDQAKQAAAAWSDGKMAVYPHEGAVNAKPNLESPDPRALLDVRIRQALAHALDLDGLNDLTTGGLAPVTGFTLPPGSPEFAQLKPYIVTYPFDRRRAEQLIQEAGFTRSGDVYRDSSGSELWAEVRSPGGGPNEQAALFLADSWKAVGAGGKANIGNFTSEQNASRPGFLIAAGSFAMDQPRRLIWYHSRDIPRAPRWVGGNSLRYSNPELDGLIDRFFITLPEQERIDLLKQIARHITENAVQMGLYHPVFPQLVHNRVQDYVPRTVYAQTYDVHLWSIR